MHDVRRLREPVPGRHRAPAAPHRRAARAGVERRRARRISGAVYNHLERRGNIWGLGYDQRQKFVESRRARDLRSGEARRAGLARLRRRVRGRLPEVAAVAVRDPAAPEACASACCRRSGARAIRPSGPATSTCSRSWRRRTSRTSRPPGPKKILTSCPHCVKTIGDDYRQVRLRGRDRALGGVRRETDAATLATAGAERHASTFHDPCYLGRYAGEVDEPRALLTRFGAQTIERAGAQSREPVLLRRRRRPAVRRQGRRAGSAHQRRAVQAAAGDRRRHGRDGLPVLFDHAEGRAGERARRPSSSST